ncbi:hypothetical protein LINPERHAP1_LOCUS12801 [Linum perenne]
MHFQPKKLYSEGDVEHQLFVSLVMKMMKAWNICYSTAL